MSKAKLGRVLGRRGCITIAAVVIFLGCSSCSYHSNVNGDLRYSRVAF